MGYAHLKVKARCFFLFDFVFWSQGSLLQQHIYSISTESSPGCDTTHLWLIGNSLTGSYYPLTDEVGCAYEAFGKAA